MFAVAFAADSGVAPGTVSLPDIISFGAVNPGPATFELQNDGDGTVGENGESADWVTPSVAGIAQHYEARASDLAGDTGDAGGTFDTWLGLSSTRQWTVSGNDKLITFTIEIRDRYTQTVRDSVSVFLGTGV